MSHRVGGPLLVLWLSLATGCGGGAPEVTPDWSLVPARRTTGTGTVALRWTRALTDGEGGPYLPVERASAALDPQRNRIYVGSTGGHLYALAPNGKPVYRYDTEGAVESRPALDAEKNELYVATEQGVMHALRASDGHLRWRDDVGGPVRSQPVLSSDAVYVVTDTDQVVAFGRADGQALWSYKRDAPDGFSIAGHAGLTYVDGRLLTGFTDGTVVALDAADGRVVWECETSVDIEMGEDATPRFFDVDTTPRVVGEIVYAASFTAGLYSFDLNNGAVIRREPEHKGVTHILEVPDGLLLASADDGLTLLNLPDRTVRWHRSIPRGAPTSPTASGNLVFAAATLGSFVAIQVADGREVARFDGGHGFSAPAEVASGLGVVLSNGGTLYAFSY